ncbi:MAG: hypothetical protein NTZ78_12920 [Candidatus Aureabacteria bacterium]|nr:hypothetical protein [Candidatus Auribacterota bacterium]
MGEIFEIGAEGVDVKNIMAEIEERVARKKEAGIYDRYDLSRIETLELSKIKSEAEYLNYLIKVIQQTWDIDIGDFPIYSKSGILGKPAVMLKKVIWKLLKFYTYRLFSQQKEFNCQVANAISSLKNKIDELAKKQ